MKRAVQARRPTKKTTARAHGARRAVSDNPKTSPDATTPARAPREKAVCEFTGSAADFLPPKLELPLLR